jgi:outer membrane protein OmpA-like peptidoglycan-associated protein
MLSKLMLLIGLLVGLFITFMCVNENKTKLSKKYQSKTITAVEEVQPDIPVVDTEPVKEEESLKEVKAEKPPIVSELDNPTFIYSVKDKGELSAKLSAKDKTPELEEFILNYCPQESCTQNLTFEDTTKVATWEESALKVAKFLKDKNVKDGMISIDDKAISIEGELKDEEENEAFNQLLKDINLDNLELKNSTTVVEPKVEETPKEPEPVKVSVEQIQNEINQLLASNPIYFKFNSSNLTQDSKNTLDQVVLLLTMLGDTPITVEGHTDSFGKASYNKRLSQQRADAVKTYLQNQNITNSIEAIGYGEERPINLNPKDQINRRVEINIKQGV